MANTKEELVQKVKELAESENLGAAYQQVADLRRQWRRARGDEDEMSMGDQELEEKFYSYLDKISARADEVQASVEETKRAIIEKAKEVLKQTNFKKATDAMNGLMDEWKAVGRANKELDDELWEEFRTVRSEFNANKNAYYENLKETFEKNTAAKQELVEKAIEANKTENMKELNTAMTNLMAEWKKIGNAGKQNEQKLWEAFNEQRQNAFAKLKEYRSKLNATFAEHAEAKKEIIAEAKRFLAQSTFTDEEIKSVTELNAKWKAVGSAGRDNEDNLWKEFRETMDLYFNHLREEKRNNY